MNLPQTQSTPVIVHHHVSGLFHFLMDFIVFNSVWLMGNILHKKNTKHEGAFTESVSCQYSHPDWGFALPHQWALICCQVTVIFILA